MAFDSVGLSFGVLEGSIIPSSTDTYRDLMSPDHSNDYNLGVSAQSIDWFSQYLYDEQIIVKTRELAIDGQLSREDMIAIFRDAKDGNIIDNNEFTDLFTIVNNASSFNMQDHVRVLSNKIINGNYANAYYQGEILGYLSPGSSSDQMEDLIDKWFFGRDRPAIFPKHKKDGYDYPVDPRPIIPLFQDGASYKDIKQGAVGDCYFLAGLGEVAFRSPITIENMFIDNGDNTYTVRFYNYGIADYVTVDDYLPTNLSGDFIYADASNELWVALAEKAYAQLNESGWIYQDGTNSYEGIEGGWDEYVVNHISGLNATSSYLDFNSMVTAFENGSPMGVSSNYFIEDVAPNIVNNHVYVVVDYNSSTQQFTLFNPWGLEGGVLDGNEKPGIVNLSFNELTTSFSYWTYVYS